MSFSQEVKDFIGGYQAIAAIKQDKAATQMAKDRLALDTQVAADDKAYKAAMLALQGRQLDRQAGSAGSGSSAAAASGPESLSTMSVSTDPSTIKPPNGKPLTVAQLAAAAKAREADANKAIGLTGTGTVPSAGASDPSVDMGEADTDMSAGEIEDLGNYAAGGLVAHAETGGVMQPQTAIPAEPAPVSPAAPAPEAATPPAPATPDPKATQIVMDKAGEAITAAVQTFDYDPAQRAVGQDEEAGMSLQELQAVTDAVDPNRIMPSHIRSGAAISGYYDYFMEKGSPEKAALAARKFLLANRDATRALGGLAMTALQNGDVNNACRLLNDACNRFPTGHQINVTPDPKYGVSYTVSNNGEVIESGHASASQLWTMLEGVQDGSLYTKQMADFAAAYLDKPKPASGRGDPDLIMSPDGQSGGMKPQAKPSRGAGNPDVVMSPDGQSGGMKPQAIPSKGSGAPGLIVDPGGQTGGMRPQARPSRGGSGPEHTVRDPGGETGGRPMVDEVTNKPIPKPEAGGGGGSWLGGLFDGSTGAGEKSTPPFQTAIPTNPAPAMVTRPNVTPGGNQPLDAATPSPQNTPTAMKPMTAAILKTARDAMARGNTREQVTKYLTDNGYSAEGL